MTAFQPKSKFLVKFLYVGHTIVLFSVVRLAKLLASLSLQIEALNLILPSEAAVRHLINNIGSMVMVFI